MAHDSGIGEVVVALLEPALRDIEQNDSQAELHDVLAFVRERLTDVVSSVDRNPGIEAAAADLYAASAALVHDRAASPFPAPRRLRLFREARLRFGERLCAVAKGAEEAGRTPTHRNQALTGA
jgi:hypothetical protein